jgi:hypothetical protein
VLADSARCSEADFISSSDPVVILNVFHEVLLLGGRQRQGHAQLRATPQIARDWLRPLIPNLERFDSCVLAVVAGESVTGGFVTDAMLCHDRK